MGRMLTVSSILLLSLLPLKAAEDWPMWRHDKARSGSSGAKLPQNPKVLWTRQLPNLEAAWWNSPRQNFEPGYQPVAVGKTLYVALNSCDRVTAFNTETGKEEWTFKTNGPVRCAPLVYKNKVFFGSDDGHMYCVNADNGRLIHSLRAGPTGRLLLGNSRYISNWPIRGGVVLSGNIIYFAAGVWPSEGVYYYALNADTCDILWNNDKSGDQNYLGPHGTSAPGAVSPQGYAVAAGDSIIFPNGRSRAVRVHAETGAVLDYYTGWKDGDWTACATGNLYLNSGELFERTTGTLGHTLGLVRGNSGPRILPVIQGSKGWAAQTGFLTSWDFAPVTFAKDVPDKIKLNYESKQFKQKGAVPPVRKAYTNGVKADRVLLLAGEGKVLCSKGDMLFIADPESEGKEIFSLRLTADITGAIAADGKIFVITKDNRLTALGNGTLAAARVPEAVRKLQTSPEADSILEATGQSEGYCLVLGIKDGRLAEGLAASSKLRVIAVCADRKVSEALSTRFMTAGVYGKKASVITADPAGIHFSEYMCNLVVSETPSIFDPEKDIPRVFTSLRPYGGTLCLPSSFTAAFSAAAEKVPSGKAAAAGNYALLKREGPIQGSDDWTHEGASAAQTNASNDDTVRLPLGVLWYGGDADGNFYTSRHTGAPRAQACGGRVFITKPFQLTVYDAYTGRLLWIRKIPGFSRGFDDLGWTFNPATTQSVGASMVNQTDGVYLHDGRQCLILEPATGKTIKTFELPGNDNWGYIGIHGKYLVAGGENNINRIDFQAGDFNKALPEEIKALIEKLREVKKTTYPATKPDAGDAEILAGMLNYLTESYRAYRDFPECETAEGDLGKNENRGAEKAHKYLDPTQGFPLDASTRKAALQYKMRAFLGYWFTIVPKYQRPGYHPWLDTSCRRLYVLDRRTGELLWDVKAKAAFRYQTIVMGNGRLYLIDNMPALLLMKLKRLGSEPAVTPTLRAFNLADGNEIWTDNTTKASMLLYSEEYDILLEALHTSTHGTKNTKREPANVYQGKDGTLLRKMRPGTTNAAFIAGKYASNSYGMFDLVTGKSAGSISRNRGCAPIAGGKHILAFRSSSQGFMDLAEGSGGGTTEFGAVRPDCSGSAIAANGLMNAPSASGDCFCSYANVTSLALIHRPDTYLWKHGIRQEDPNHNGINLGAPGDRVDENRCSWYEYPLAENIPGRGGGSFVISQEAMDGEKKKRNIGVTITGDSKMFKLNPRHMRKDALPWVGASGLEGACKLRIDIFSPAQRRWKNATMRLYFAEPETNMKTGERLFTVSLAGEDVLKEFDILKEAGAARKTIIKEFKGVQLNVPVELELTAVRGKPILCGIEIEAK